MAELSYIMWGSARRFFIPLRLSWERNEILENRILCLWPGKYRYRGYWPVCFTPEKDFECLRNIIERTPVLEAHPGNPGCPGRTDCIRLGDGCENRTHKSCFSCNSPRTPTGFRGAPVFMPPRRNRKELPSI